MQIATEKQFEYAKKIAETLGLQLPRDFTVKSYSEFISRYENEFKREKQRYDCYDEDEGIQ